MVNRDEPRSLELEVRKTARIFLWGPEPRSSDRVLVALHGYAQHPAFFLRRLEPLVQEGWSIIAPEGLHRFYVQGTSGRVGASWMTAEERAADIRDYLRYLDTVREQLLAPEKEQQRRVLLGFSQGVPTAARWAAHHSHHWDQLIFWAGIFPPDIDQHWQVAPNAWNPLPIDVALGDQDPFFQESHLLPAQDWFEKRGIPFRRHKFSGGHHLDAPLLTKILNSALDSRR